MRKWLLGSALLALAATAFASPPSWLPGVAERFPGEFLGIRTWQWIGLLILIGIGILFYIAGRFLAKRVMHLRERSSGAKAHTGEKTIRRGAGILGFVLAWHLFHETLDLNLEARNNIHAIAEALTIAGFVLIIYGIWDAICDTLGAHAGSVANAQKLLIPVTRKLVRFLILLVGLILALGAFGVNLTGLLAGVGIGGLVVALAAKDSVENVFGSLTILFDMPFAIGDWVKIDKFEGIVEEINLRSTRIRTFEDSIITLPNANLIKAAVENYGARRYRRQRFQVRVSYANDPDRLEAFLDGVREYLASVPNAIRDRSLVEVNDMTEASIGVLVQCFFEAGSFIEEAALRSELMLAILRAGDDAGVIFVGTPIPQKEPKQHEETDEERKRRLDSDDII